jgi:hypothetical protein
MRRSACASEPGDHIVLVAIGAHSKICRIVSLEALSQVGSKRKVGLGIIYGERNIFQAVKRFPRHVWIGKHRPIFFPAVEHDRRPRRCRRVAILCLNRPGEKQCDGSDERPTTNLACGSGVDAAENATCRSLVRSPPYRRLSQPTAPGNKGIHDIRRKFSPTAAGG